MGTALRSGNHAATNVCCVAVHGTGTPLGDPIEVGALSAALASHGTRVLQGVALGSVKVSGVRLLCGSLHEALKDTLMALVQHARLCCQAPAIF